MKIAAHTLGWGNYYKEKHDISRALEEIKGLGFDGVELYEGLSQIGLDGALKDLLLKTGLELVSLSCSLNSNLPAGASVAGEKSEDLEEAKLRASYAAKFGVKALMVCGGWKDNKGQGARVKGQGAMTILAKKLDALAEYAKRYDMDVAFHPHLGTILETEEDIDELLKKSRLTKLCIDVAHLKARGEDPALLIRKYKDRLVYIHLKDWDEKSKSFVPLGSGCVDIKGALQALDETGYDGWLTIELDEPDVEPKEAMGKSLEHLRKCHPEGAHSRSLP